MVKICTTGFNNKTLHYFYTLYLCVLCNAYNKQPMFSYITDYCSFLWWKHNVFYWWGSNWSFVQFSPIEFYVLLTVNPSLMSQINPTRCTILFNTFIYFSSLHVSGVHASIIRRKLLYLWDTVTCHSVCVASDLLVGLKSNTHTEWQMTVSHRYGYSNFLLVIGAWTPETCREEK